MKLIVEKCAGDLEQYEYLNIEKFHFYCKVWSFNVSCLHTLRDLEQWFVLKFKFKEVKFIAIGNLTEFLILQSLCFSVYASSTYVNNKKSFIITIPKILN